MIQDGTLKAFYIGDNMYSESGISSDIKYHIKELTPCPIDGVNRVYSGKQLTIYVTNDFTKINILGKFKCTGAINILKPCVSPISRVAFFISNDHKLYGCGH